MTHSTRAQRLIRDFGLPEAPRAQASGNGGLRDLYGIVGGAVAGSLSPRIHRAAYRQMGLQAGYWPFNTDDFEGFWREMITAGGLEELGWAPRGFTVVAPHKKAPLKLSGIEAASPAVAAHGGNLLARRGDRWFLDSSDPEGVLGAARERGLDPAGLPSAVLGCGGAGLAAATALQSAGARVTLVNRTEAHGQSAAAELGVGFLPLSRLQAGTNPLRWKIFVSAVPLASGSSEPPFDLARLPDDALVVDYVYRRGSTPLVRAARRRGLQVADGFEVLRLQSRRQIEGLTGHSPEPGSLRKILEDL